MNTFFVVIPKVRKLQFGMTITINNKALEVAGNEALQEIVFHAWQRH